MENKLVIPFGEYKIIAEVMDMNEPEIPPELCVYICDNNNYIVQDICLVRPHYHVNRKTMEFERDDDFVDCLVWANSDCEDYTHEHVIGVYNGEENE